MKVGPSPPRARSTATWVGLVDCQHIIAINCQAGHGITFGALAQLTDRRLLVLRGAFAVLIVLAEEDHRQLPQAGEVQCLVERTFICGAIAKEGKRNA